MPDLLAQRVLAGRADSQQPVLIRARTRAAAAGLISQASPAPTAVRCPPWSRPGEAIRLFARGVTLLPGLPVAALLGCVLSAINEGARIAAGHVSWPTWGRPVAKRKRPVA